MRADTGARLRKTFTYHGGDDEISDLEPEALDEEEQETLIESLQRKNTASNALYTQAFLTLPALSAIPYLSTLLQPRLSLLSILSISSLACTAYILVYLPHDRIGIDGIDARFMPAAASVDNRKRLPQLGDVVDRGPVELYLAWLNAVLVALIAFAGMLLRNEQGFFGMGFLPALVFLVVVAAKAFMASVDVGQLEGLRYGYKGA